MSTRQTKGSAVAARKHLREVLIRENVTSSDSGPSQPKPKTLVTERLLRKAIRAKQKSAQANLSRNIQVLKAQGKRAEEIRKLYEKIKKKRQAAAAQAAAAEGAFSDDD